MIIEIRRNWNARSIIKIGRIMKARMKRSFELDIKVDTPTMYLPKLPRMIFNVLILCS